VDSEVETEEDLEEEIAEVSEEAIAVDSEVETEEALEEEIAEVSEAGEVVHLPTPAKVEDLTAVLQVKIRKSLSTKLSKCVNCTEFPFKELYLYLELG